MNPWGNSPFKVLTVDPEITILASTSPRRVEILKNIGVKFTVVPSQFPENLARSKNEENSQIKYVCETAKMKALEVYERICIPRSKFTKAKFIVSADTIVYLPETDEILEKPKSRFNAAEMLTLLSGKEHVVYSAVVIICLDDNGKMCDTLVDYEQATSKMDHLDADFIEAYTTYSDETLDKAGACAEFGLLSVFVKEMKGTFYTVMGFPVKTFYNLIVNYLK